MNKLIIHILLFHFWLAALLTPSIRTFLAEPVVHAVLFYSPNCGHCHLVITETILPLVEQYGEQLIIVGVDTTQPAGQVLFRTAVQHFKLETAGVPLLAIGDTYLYGSLDIPEKLPGMIEQYLAQGGVDWPDVPGLAEAMAAAENAQTPTPLPGTQTDPALATTTTSPAPPVATPTSPGLILTSDQDSNPWENLRRDPVGNGLSLLVLGGMILSLIGGVYCFLRSSGAPPGVRWGWLIPVLSIVGLAVAAYMAYVETTQVDAVCGPVGDCNAVQQSEYARLFGVLPIGVLGMVGYFMILLAWGIGRFARSRLAAYASLAMLGLTVAGLLFSIYLTFLEPFVIGATCAWCLTSAIIMTALFWLSITPARSALSNLQGGNQKAFA